MKITLHGDHRATYGDQPRRTYEGDLRWPVEASYDPDTDTTNVHFSRTAPGGDQ